VENDEREWLEEEDNTIQEEWLSLSSYYPLGIYK
jgi:hypothetical protein